MGFNRFQWWKKGVKSKKPLTGSSHTVLDQIRHGDFDYPIEYLKALENVRLEKLQIYKRIEKEMYGRSQSDIDARVREESRIKNVKEIKLNLEMGEKEAVILIKLRSALKKEFGIDLWGRIEAGEIEVNTLEELYNLYKSYKTV